MFNLFWSIGPLLQGSWLELDALAAMPGRTAHRRGEDGLDDFETFQMCLHFLRLRRTSSQEATPATSIRPFTGRSLEPSARALSSPAVVTACAGERGAPSNDAVDGKPRGNAIASSRASSSTSGETVRASRESGEISIAARALPVEALEPAMSLVSHSLRIAMSNTATAIGSDIPTP